jgi:hypothetical protein
VLDTNQDRAGSCQTTLAGDRRATAAVAGVIDVARTMVASATRGVMVLWSPTSMRPSS